MKEMTSKNLFLGLTPVFALMVVLYGSSELTPVRIGCAVIPAGLFVTYVVLWVRNKNQKGDE